MLRAVRLWTVVLLLLPSGCSSLSNVKSAEEAVVRLHGHHSSRNFASAYAEADESFRAAVGASEYMRSIQGVREKLGAVKSTSRTGWHMKLRTDGTYVSLTYRTEFEKSGATEAFLFRIVGDRARLVNYAVESPVLPDFSIGAPGPDMTRIAFAGVDRARGRVM